MKNQLQHSFTFGIYPGGVAGTENGMATGAADDPAAINKAIHQLQDAEPRFIIRNYIHYKGNGALLDEDSAVHQITHYCTSNRKLDLVLCFQASSFEPNKWEQAICRAFDLYGCVLDSLQLTEEPNLYHAPADGQFTAIAQVVAHGVRFAAQEARRRGLSVKIGFNAVPCFNPADPFWTSLKPLIDADFLAALDYVGFDFFPDVFGPPAPDAPLSALVEPIKAVLRHFRHVNLADVGIGPGIPIHIAENGWPTSSSRHPERQAAILETIIRTIHSARQELNITQYELFSLRDASSSTDNFMYQFGILRDDYSPKPAFFTYQKLIAELTA